MREREREKEKPNLEGNESLWIYNVEECLLSFTTQEDTTKIETNRGPEDRNPPQNLF